MATTASRSCNESENPIARDTRGRRRDADRRHPDERATRATERAGAAQAVSPDLPPEAPAWCRLGRDGRKRCTGAGTTLTVRIRPAAVGTCAELLAIRGGALSAAFIVPLLFTKSRSPASSHRGRSLKWACSTRPVSRSDPSRRTPSRRRPLASGGSAASSCAGQADFAATPADAIAHPPAGPRSAAHEPPLDPGRTASARTAR